MSSIDGAVTAEGASAGLGTPADKAVFTILRELADAVLVGAGTVRAENYGGVRLSEAVRADRTTRGMSAVPPIVVVTASADIDPTSRVFTDTAVAPVVITSAHAPVDARRRLAATGADVVEVPGDDVSTASIVQTLDARGLHRVLCEGGPGLFGRLLSDDAVDDVCLTISPVVVAGDAGRISRSASSSIRRLTRAHVLADDDGTLLTRWVKHRDDGAPESTGGEK